MKALSIIGIILAILDFSVIFGLVANLISMLNLRLPTGMALGPLEFIQLVTPAYLLAISIVALIKVGKEKK